MKKGIKECNDNMLCSCTTCSYESTAAMCRKRQTLERLPRFGPVPALSECAGKRGRNFLPRSCSNNGNSDV